MRAAQVTLRRGLYARCLMFEISRNEESLFSMAFIGIIEY